MGCGSCGVCSARSPARLQLYTHHLHVGRQEAVLVHVALPEPGAKVSGLLLADQGQLTHRAAAWELPVYLDSRPPSVRVLRAGASLAAVQRCSSRLAAKIAAQQPSALSVTMTGSLWAAQTQCRVRFADHLPCTRLYHLLLVVLGWCSQPTTGIMQGYMGLLGQLSTIPPSLKPGAVPIQVRQWCACSVPAQRLVSSQYDCSVLTALWEQHRLHLKTTCTCFSIAPLAGFGLLIGSQAELWVSISTARQPAGAAIDRDRNRCRMLGGSPADRASAVPVAAVQVNTTRSINIMAKAWNSKHHQVQMPVGAKACPRQSMSATCRPGRDFERHRIQALFTTESNVLLRPCQHSLSTPLHAVPFEPAQCARHKHHVHCKDKGGSNNSRWSDHAAACSESITIVQESAE